MIMWFIKGGRASGKTVLLIQQSALTGQPILVTSIHRARLLKDRAKEMKLHIPEPIVWKNENHGDRAEVLADDGEELINRMLRETMGIRCVGMAVNGPLTVLDRHFLKDFGTLPPRTLERLEFERYVNGTWDGHSGSRRGCGGCQWVPICGICENEGSALCRECKMEVKSGFELREDGDGK